jgi:hypothetical protein
LRQREKVQALLRQVARFSRADIITHEDKIPVHDSNIPCRLVKPYLVRVRDFKRQSRFQHELLRDEYRPLLHRCHERNSHVLLNQPRRHASGRPLALDDRGLPQSQLPG